MGLPQATKNPDHVLSTGEHEGFQWLVLHNTMGYRWGFICVPKGHPWYGVDYKNIHLDVHGGLTFCAFDEPSDPRASSDAYWLGFDCAHAGDAQDLSLPWKVVMDHPGDTIRTQEYVESECRSLCEQAKIAAENPVPDQQPGTDNN